MDMGIPICTAVLLTLFSISSAQLWQVTNHSNRAKELPFATLDNDLESRVINGVDAKAGQVPYIALVGNQNFGPFCGGALISKKHVLTAAHCIWGRSSFTVTLGSLKTGYFDTNGYMGTASRDVIKATYHPKYSDYDWHYDIAVLELESEVALSDKIQIVNLPSDKERSADAFDLKTATLAGYGRNSPRSTSMSRTLKVTKLKVRTPQACRQFWKNRYAVDDNEICTHFDNRSGSCNGDSGGPLVVNDSKTLVGIVSRGSRSCMGTPTIYTFVGGYLDWIADQTGIPVRQ